MNNWHWDGESNDLPQPFCWVLSDRRHSCRLTTALQRMMPHTGIYNQVQFVSVMFSGVLSMQSELQKGFQSLMKGGFVFRWQTLDGKNKKKSEKSSLSLESCRYSNEGHQISAACSSSFQSHIWDKRGAVHLHSCERTVMGGFSADCHREFKPSCHSAGSIFSTLHVFIPFRNRETSAGGWGRNQGKQRKGILNISKCVFTNNGGDFSLPPQVNKKLVQHVAFFQ